MVKTISSFIFPILLFAVFSLLSHTGIFGQTSAKDQPAVSDAATPRAKSTIDGLRTAIRQRLASPDVRRGQIGIKVVSLDSGSVVFEENAEKYFMPASNMKNFTVAAALEKLNPDFKFVTSVYAAAMPNSDGVIVGPVRVFGRGDVSISYSFFDGDYFKGMDRLADAIAAAGVRRIEGDLIGDDTYFTGDAKPGSWEWDDLQFYYGAEVSALPINDNSAAISVVPGPVGYGCTVRLTPPNLVFRVVNKCTTTPTGTRRTLRIVKELDRNIIEITGDMPSGGGPFNGFVSVSRPAEMFVAMLRQRLEQKGVIVSGQARTIDPNRQMPVDQLVEIARIESPPLSLIAAKTLKPSQNMYTETIFRTLGEEIGRKRVAENTKGKDSGANLDSQELGRLVVRDFLKEIGVDDDAVLQYDGSGLSRQNLVTPSAIVRLYAYMAKQSKYSQVWLDSLTIGGVDGTLRNRFKGTRGEANLRGKTGTINQVSALSGYLTTASGQKLAFSMIVNGVGETSARTGLIDDIVVQLANFDGSID